MFYYVYEVSGHGESFLRDDEGYSNAWERKGRGREAAIIEVVNVG